MSKVVSIRMTEQDLARVAAAAKREGVLPSTFIRNAAVLAAVSGMATSSFFHCNAPGWSDPINGNSVCSVVDLGPAVGSNPKEQEGNR